MDCEAPSTDGTIADALLLSATVALVRRVKDRDRALFSPSSAEGAAEGAVVAEGAVAAARKDRIYGFAQKPPFHKITTH